jgi:hypothetical protein
VDKSCRTIPVASDNSSKILLGSSSATCVDVAAEVGIAAESVADVVVAL